MADKAPVVPEIKKKKHRSPAYPAVNLAQAIKRADEFYRHELKNPASFSTVSAHWGFKPTSSGALLTAAALKSFGLVNELESTTGRTLQVSPLGLKIVADKRPESVERDAAIKEAALRPKIHALIWRRWNGTLPSDTELSYRLENEWDFNVNSIPGVIKELRDTISFAKLSASDSVSQGVEDSHEDEEHTVKIGDFVQWEPQGILQFREPRQVSRLSDDGQFVFVDGSPTGMPIAEVSVEEPPANAPKPPLVTPLRVITRNSGGSTTVRQDVFSLTEGEVVLNWPTPLSQESITEFTDWLELVKRKVVRATKASEPLNDAKSE
jgi:hypothetical protein